MGNDCSCGRRREKAADGSVPSPYNVLQSSHERESETHHHHHHAGHAGHAGHGPPLNGGAAEYYDPYAPLPHAGDAQHQGGGRHGSGQFSSPAGSARLDGPHILHGQLPDGYGPLPAQYAESEASSAQGGGVYAQGYGPVGGAGGRTGSVDSMSGADPYGRPVSSKFVERDLSDDEDDDQNWEYPAPHHPPGVRGSRAPSAAYSNNGGDYSGSEYGAGSPLGPVAHNPPAQFRPPAQPASKPAPMARYLSHTMSSMRKSKRASVSAVADQRAKSLERSASVSPRKRKSDTSPRKRKQKRTPMSARGSSRSSRVDDFLSNTAGVW